MLGLRPTPLALPAPSVGLPLHPAAAAAWEGHFGHLRPERAQLRTDGASMEPRLQAA